MVEELYHHYDKNNAYKSCSFATAALGSVLPNEFDRLHNCCVYLRICSSCGYAGMESHCQICAKRNFGQTPIEGELVWKCSHVQDYPMCREFLFRSIYQGELSLYFCAKSMRYMGQEDNWHENRFKYQ